MPLHQIKDFDPNYRQHFDDRDILKFDVYSGSEKVGSVDDLLVDDSGQFRYLVINTGVWIVGKKVLLPIGRSRIDDTSRRVYVDGLSREQVKQLPEYKGEAIDYDYEERVRGVYRPAIATRGTTSVPATSDRHTYHYDQDPTLYHLNDRDHGLLRRSEARMMSGRPIAGKHRRSVGVFPTRQAAEQALHDLRDSGFPMGRVSVVTRDADKHDEIAGADVRDRVGNKADEGATIGAVSGGALGGLTGLLVGLGTLAIPGVGPIMLAGATATALATTLAGGAIGAVSGGLLGALLGLGIPEERARVYHDRIARGGYLVIVDGTDTDIARAEAILRQRGIEDYGVYDAPGAHAATAHPGAIASTPVTSTSGTNRVGLQHKRAIGLFSQRQDAETALLELRAAGFPMDRVSLIAKQAGESDRIAGVAMHSQTGNKADEGAKAGATAGGALGGLGGLLVGLGTLAIPGIGPVLLGGATATAIATTLAGGAIGAVAGGLTGALVGLGIPEDRAKVYNDRVAHGDYLVMIDGTEAEVQQAESVLRRHKIHEWGIYDAADVDTTRHPQTTTERHTAPDVDSSHRDSRIDPAHPQVTILDNRDETRR